MKLSLFKRAEKPAPEMMTLAEHDRRMLAYKRERDAAYQRLNTDIQVLRKAVVRGNLRYAELEEKADSLRADAQLWRTARAKRKAARSNLKQFREQKAVA